MTIIPQPSYSPDLIHADFFFVPKVELHPERSLISGNGRGRKKFATEPMHYPTQCIPELEKMLIAAYRQWRGVH
jgi:hypothetical protein